jgi:single-strand DNA-binding protein
MSARSLNKVLLIGNLTRDPELRYTAQGTAVCTFGMATNRQWTPADGGERQEEVEYHRIVAWAKLAEICAQILHKGRKVYCEGRLQTRNWTGQDGQERTTTEVVIDTMIALGPPKSGMTAGVEVAVDEESFEEPGEVAATGGVAAAATAAPSDDTLPEEEEKPEEKPVKKAAQAAPKKKVVSKKASEKTGESKGKKAGEEKEEVSEDDIPF